jgi:hypothetical protein
MKYRIGGTLAVSCYTVVDASSPEEALEIAQERQVADLFYNAMSPGEDKAWNFGNDGEPYDLRIDGEEY